MLSITVSLVSRLIFDFCFHYSKLRHEKDALNDVPVMIVCEEAHNYIPQRDDAAYRSSRKSLERVAKEGRKYGLSLMVVSQRPSEVSETNVTDIIKWARRRRADARAPQLLAPLALGKAWVGV